MIIGTRIALWLLAACLFGAGAARAEEPSGDWVGTLMTPAGELHLSVHLRKRSDGKYEGTLDSLDQGARGLALVEVSASADGLAFAIPTIQGHYAARWDATAQAWNGAWTQAAANLPLKLRRGLPPAAPTVQGLNGDWDGTVEVNGTKLRLAFHVTTTVAGGTTATLDSIDQNASGIGLSGVIRSGDQVVLELKFMGVRFEGRLSLDGQQIAGMWHQGPSSLPLTITRRATGGRQAKLNRPQTPAGPFPYRSEEVAFDNPAASTPVRLAGTLTLPPGKGPFPAVVLIAGSGRNARDEEIFGHKIFLVLADHLTRHGLAVLRVDKRGVGRSTGDFGRATTRNFASDVDAGLAFLRARPDVDHARIGLIGHSEGGLIAPMVAAHDPRVGFIVLMAGPGETGAKVLLQQGHLISLASGVDEATTAAGDEVRAKVIHVLQDGPDPAAARTQAALLLTEYGRAQGVPETVMTAQLQMLSSDWTRLFLSYDPAPALRHVKCPVLAIAGSKDLQVPPKENLTAIRAALANNRHATVKELPGLNHLFQPAVTGSPLEYGSIETTVAPVALDTITAWVLRHTMKHSPGADRHAPARRGTDGT